ncbi:glycosyltransferase [Sulfitobacter sp. S0837]|uniref:glycosyltransferase n=1 Tax=Sulfitobacter maritimus TaxID=2741719 RepID=UPI001583ECA5|nr:glycosyltransferase [Sulfitobacter maritimus]NUH65506.1 glycosyltransferase [Sulfitobacter maritimus]
MTSLILITIICVFLQLYHYVFYPLIIAAFARFKKRRDSQTQIQEFSVSLIICAYDEAGIISQKLSNSIALDPPPDEIILICDGSTDGTEQVARALAARQDHITVLYRPERQGKSAAMNRAAAKASGDIMLFSDANAIYASNAVEAIRRGFSDPSVAVVSGAKHTKGADGVGVGDSLYWRYEAWIRRCETRIGSTVASVGEIIAVRRKDWRPIPGGTVNDDAWLTLSNLARGRRVVFAPEAHSYEPASADHDLETQRRRRMNAGRLRLIGRAENWPWRYPWPLFAFLSHKVLRLFLPIFMLLGFATNFAVVLQEAAPRIMEHLFALQLAGAALILVGGVAARRSWRLRLPLAAYHVYRGNIAALFAMWDILRGKSYAIWEKPAR